MILALTPQNNEAFLREVDDELRRDDLTRFWRRYGLLVAAGLVLALAAFAGWLIWQQRQMAAAGREGAELARAIDSLSKNNLTGAKASLDTLAASETPGYRATARLAQADVALQAGNRADAARLYQAVATDTGVGEPFRDLALVRATAAEFDTLPPATVIQRLARLAQPGNPWFGSAGEMVAMAQLNQGNGAEAARLFTALANDAAIPRSIRSRAVQMASVVDAVGAARTPAAPAAQENAR